MLLGLSFVHSALDELVQGESELCDVVTLWWLGWKKCNVTRSSDEFAKDFSVMRIEVVCACSSLDIV